MTVIVILGIAAAVSYPSLSASYARSRLTASAFDIAAALKTARGLSVASSDGRVYGVLFKPEGEYQIYSLPGETAVSPASFSDPLVAVPCAIKHTIDPSVSVANFIAAPLPFCVIFLDDGVPTADGVSIPLPDDVASIKLSSLVVNGQAIVKISKSSGLAEVRQ